MKNIQICPILLNDAVDSQAQILLFKRFWNALVLSQRSFWKLLGALWIGFPKSLETHSMAKPRENCKHLYNTVSFQNLQYGS